MAQFASKSCDICMSGPGKNCCKQCDQWLCDNCKTLHLRSKISRNHSFHSGSNIHQEDKSFCNKHNENYIFYCNDCDKPICKLCIVKNHKKHDMSEINESTQELQAEVKSVIDSKFKYVKKKLDKFGQRAERYQYDVTEAIRAIREDGKQMKQLIDKKVQALIESLEEKEAASLLSLQSARTEFQNDLEKIKKCQKAFNDIQGIVDATKRLKQLQHIKYELDVTGLKQSIVMPKVKYCKKSASKRDIVNLFGDLSFQEKGYSVDTFLLKDTREKGSSVENISQEDTRYFAREQSPEPLYTYQCSMCRSEIEDEKEPIMDTYRSMIIQLIRCMAYNMYSWSGKGNDFHCQICRTETWFAKKY